jgi:hypothetical protein
MAYGRVVFRVTRAIAISLCTLLLIALALVQYKDHIIRRRSERLLADFQSVRLNQTTWSEAQALMQRWGTLGHAHGPCSSTDCAYDITVTGWPSLLPNGAATPWLYRFGGRFPVLLQFVGMRFSVLELRFLIEDGLVRRTRLHITAETEDAVLLVTAKSYAALNGSEDGAPNNVGADEGLAMHPDFIVGSDGFCTGCETISLAYTPHIAPDELARLTSFNISCFTRMRPCVNLSALAPALMQEDAATLRSVPRNSVPCTTPAWALARDAEAIWLVDTLSTGRVLDPNPPYGEKPSPIEEDQIRLISILKGPSLIPPQTTLRFRPYSGVEYQARAVPEHLSQGHRYILLPSIYSDWLKEGVQAWRCGVLNDTPSNELAVKQGIAMNDHLRIPELTGAWPW